MADFKVLIPYVPDNDEDIDIDLCQDINAMIGHPVPEITGVTGRIVTDIDRIYFSEYTSNIIVLVNTREAA
jgi:hypothetical protein